MMAALLLCKVISVNDSISQIIPCHFMESLRSSLKKSSKLTAACHLGIIPTMNFVSFKKKQQLLKVETEISFSSIETIKSK